MICCKYTNFTELRIIVIRTQGLPKRVPDMMQEKIPQYQVFELPHLHFSHFSSLNKDHRSQSGGKKHLLSQPLSPVGTSANLPTQFYHFVMITDFI